MRKKEILTFVKTCVDIDDINKCNYLKRLKNSILTYYW